MGATKAPGLPGTEQSVSTDQLVKDHLDRDISDRNLQPGVGQTRTPNMNGPPMVSIDS